MTPSPTCTGSAAPAGPEDRVPQCFSSPPGSGTCSRPIERATRQKLIEAELPSVEDVNAQRVVKFRDSISDALGAPGFDMFRRLIEDYERDSDVPMADIAAALALQSRNGAEFLMSPEPPPEKHRRDDRPARSPPGRSGPRDGAFATYRIDVGKRHKVMPGAIVGAIANEGGLHRSDFGHITIRTDFSLVELPAKLPAKDAESAWRTPVFRASADQSATRPRAARSRTANRNDAVQRHQRRRRPGRPRVGRDAGAGRVAHRDPCRGGTPGMATHAAYTTGKYTHGYLGLVYSRMEIGVPIFFVLSGFLLFGPWVKATATGGQRHRCAGTPGIGCAASCPPTSSRC